MDIPAVVMPVRVGAYKGLVSGEMCLAELLAQLLRPVYGQAVVCSVPWVRADDIVVAFHIFPFLVFLMAEIGSHTGNSEILAPAGNFLFFYVFCLLVLFFKFFALF